MLNHRDQILPFKGQRGGIFIEGRKDKTPGFKLFVINHQSGILHVKDFHDGLVTVDKDEHFSIAHIAMHGRRYDTTEGIKTLAHINRCRIKVIFQGLMQVEHRISQKDE